MFSIQSIIVSMLLLSTNSTAYPFITLETEPNKYKPFVNKNQLLLPYYGIFLVSLVLFIHYLLLFIENFS